MADIFMQAPDSTPARTSLLIVPQALCPLSVPMASDMTVPMRPNLELPCSYPSTCSCSRAASSSIAIISCHVAESPVMLPSLLSETSKLTEEEPAGQLLPAVAIASSTQMPDPCSIARHLSR